VYGDSKTFGKKIGGDIVCNKKTFLLIKALEKANNSQRKELEKWFNDADSDPDAKIEAVRNIYDALHLKTVSENIIEQYYLMAMDCFSSIDVPDWRKSELLTMAENLMYREK
jgi:geranylgeranyl diphosphate synthase type II